jgi:hypothetical protein
MCSGRNREGQKILNGANHDFAALETICQDYMRRAATVVPEVFVEMLAEHLNTLDEDAAGEFIKAIRERVRHAL